MGSLRRRKHLQDLPCSKNAGSSQQGPCRYRYHRRRGIRSRGHREGLCPVRQHEHQRHPQERRYCIQGSLRFRCKGDGLQHTEARGVEGVRRYLHQSFASDGQLHYHREGLCHGSRLCPGRHQEGTRGMHHDHLHGHRTSERALQGRCHSDGRSQHGQLLPERPEAVHRSIYHRQDLVRNGHGFKGIRDLALR